MKGSPGARPRLLLLRESLGLLREALLPAYSDPAFGLGALFEEGFYSELLGQFDLVNVSIEYGNPLDATLQAAARDSGDELHPLAALGERTRKGG